MENNDMFLTGCFDFIRDIYRVFAQGGAISRDDFFRLMRSCALLVGVDNIEGTLLGSLDYKGATVRKWISGKQAPGDQYVLVAAMNCMLWTVLSKIGKQAMIR